MHQQQQLIIQDNIWINPIYTDTSPLTHKYLQFKSQIATTSLSFFLLDFVDLVEEALDDLEPDLDLFPLREALLPTLLRLDERDLDLDLERDFDFERLFRESAEPSSIGVKIQYNFITESRMI